MVIVMIDVMGVIVMVVVMMIVVFVFVFVVMVVMMVCMMGVCFFFGEGFFVELVGDVRYFFVGFEEVCVE